MVGGPYLCDFGEVVVLKMITKNSKNIVIIACMCRSDDNFELVSLSTCHVGSGDRFQVSRLAQ